MEKKNFIGGGFVFNLNRKPILLGLAVLCFFLLAKNALCSDCGKKNPNCRPAPSGRPAEFKPRDPDKPKSVGKPSRTSGEHVPKDVVLIYDVTDSTTPETNEKEKGFAKVVSQLGPGDGFAAICGTENSFSSLEYLVHPQKLTMRVGYWEEELRRQRARIISQFKHAISATPQERPATSLLDAIYVAAQMLREMDNTKKTLVIISDMREHRPQLNEDTIFQRGNDVLSKMRADGQVPDLLGVQVFCMGCSTKGLSPAQWQAIRNWWFKLFATSGSQVRSYDIGLNRQIE